MLCAPSINMHVLSTLPQASCWLWGVEPEASKGSSQRGLSVPLGQLGESRDTIGDGTEAARALSVCLVPLRSSEDTGDVVHWWGGLQATLQAERLVVQLALAQACPTQALC